MKTTTFVLLMTLLSLGQAHAKNTLDDEKLSQKYEAMILDGEDKDIIEDQMTTEEVTPEDLELKEEMEGEYE